MTKIGSLREEFAALLDGPRRPEAVFVMNSRSLDTVSGVLHEKGVQMGRDISILVNGSNALLIPGSPGYSIIDLDIGLAAENCVKLLQRLISDPQVEVPCIVSPYGPIIERGSLLPESAASGS